MVPSNVVFLGWPFTLELVRQPEFVTLSLQCKGNAGKVGLGVRVVQFRLSSETCRKTMKA